MCHSGGAEGPEFLGQPQPQTQKQHSHTIGDAATGPDQLSQAMLCGVQPVAGATAAAAAVGTTASVAVGEGCTEVECEIFMGFNPPVHRVDSMVAAEAARKAEAEGASALGCAVTAGTEVPGPAPAAGGKDYTQPVGRKHGTLHGIASALLPGAEASSLAAGDTAGDALAADVDAPDVAGLGLAGPASALQEAEGSTKSKAFSCYSSAVTVGSAEVEHPSTSSAVEAARWGSSIPRMPVALREGFLAEVKSLQKKPIMKITTSVEGAYGESSVSSLFKLFSILNKHFGLNEHSTFLDIGSGSGVPSLAAAAFGCTFTLGLELDSNVYSISVINHLSLVDLLLLQQLYLGAQLNWHRTEEFINSALTGLCQPYGISASGAATRAQEQGQARRECCECMETTLDSPSASGDRDYPGAQAPPTAAVATCVAVGHAERSLLETTFGFNATFCVFDCARLSSLEGISHVFSFDLAMPPWVMAHTVRLFNQSKTTFVFVSFHGDLISNFGMQAVLATRLSMRMGTSAESHVGFIYQKIPKTETQHELEQQRKLHCIEQQLVDPVVADSASVTRECRFEGKQQMQMKQLQWQLASLQGQLQELLQQQQQRRRHPSKLQRQRKDLLRALQDTKQETLQMLQLMLHHQQQGLLLRQQLQLVELLQRRHGECRESQASLLEEAARLLEEQHLQEHHALVQKLSVQYWAENKRQQTLLKEATAAVAVEVASAAAVRRNSEIDSKVQKVRRELREKQKQLHNMECMMNRREEHLQRSLEEQLQSELLLHQQSGLDSRHFEGSNWLLEGAQQHATDVQQRQRQQLLLLKGIASSRTDRILHSIAAAGRLQQMAQIFVAAVSMLQHGVSRQKEAITTQQEQKLPCCCSGCCYPLYRGSSEQPAAAAARVELMSAAHPQQQLLLLRRVFSAFQVDQLLERGSLMQGQQQEGITAARAEELLAHFRDVSVQGYDNQTQTTAAATAAAGKENAAKNTPYQCPCTQTNRCIRLSTSNSSSNSNCTVCIGGAAAALAAMLPSIPYSRSNRIELQFCCQGQQQLQRKRLPRPIRRYGPSAAASSAAPARLPAGGEPSRYGDSARSGEEVVILPCLSPLCATCCYSDSLLLQLLRCSFPLAVQQQLLQQEVFMQQRMPLITVIDKQEQQQLEQRCMQDWKTAKAANPAVPLAGAEAMFRRGMVECPLADAFDALQLLQQQLQQEPAQPTQAHLGPGPGVALETKYLEAAFRRHFEKLLEVQRQKLYLRDSLFSRKQARAPVTAIATVVGESDDNDNATRQKRITTSVGVLGTPCRQEFAAASFEQQPKRPRLSTLLPGLTGGVNVAADRALPAARGHPTSVTNADFSSACCSDVRAPFTASDDAGWSQQAEEIRLHPHEAQLLRACAVAAVKPSRCSCTRALQLLLQQRRILQHSQSEGCKNASSSGPPARNVCKWASNAAPKSNSAAWSVLSDADCCSTHSNRSACTNNSSKRTAIRCFALVTVVGEQLQEVMRNLVEMQRTLKQQLLLKLLQRDFPDHSVTRSTAIAATTEHIHKGAVQVTDFTCSCAPQLHLEQQEVLFHEGKGSCVWWRQYYVLLGELAILKEKALYKAIDICLQQQQHQQSISQELPTQQPPKQQQLQPPRGGQAKRTPVSLTKGLITGGEGPNICKASDIGCRLPDPLLQSPSAPRKRRSQGGF